MRPSKILLLSLLSIPSAAFACASCGCTLSPELETLGISSTPGLKLDLRADFVNQNQLRSGTGAISGSDAAKVTNANGAQEVEKSTKNTYYTVGFDYVFNQDWAVNLQLPYITREHSTFGQNSDGSTAAEGAYDSKTNSLGDIKLIGRYQGFTQQHNFGVMFGVKLPTGGYSQTGTSSDPTNIGGVTSIDRGLQPGTGTTDLIYGLYYTDLLNENWDYFVQGLFQTATNSRDDYKPGDSQNLNIGFRYQGFQKVTPIIQLNARHSDKDSGAQADIYSTGGNLVYLSPGFTLPLDQNVSLYGFVQVPLFHNVNGVQLTPAYTATVGARFSF